MKGEIDEPKGGVNPDRIQGETCHDDITELKCERISSIRETRRAFVVKPNDEGWESIRTMRKGQQPFG